MHHSAISGLRRSTSTSRRCIQECSVELTTTWNASWERKRNFVLLSLVQGRIGLANLTSSPVRSIFSLPFPGSTRISVDDSRLTLSPVRRHCQVDFRDLLSVVAQRQDESVLRFRLLLLRCRCRKRSWTNMDPNPLAIAVFIYGRDLVLRDTSALILNLTSDLEPTLGSSNNGTASKICSRLFPVALASCCAAPGAEGGRLRFSGGASMLSSIQAWLALISGRAWPFEGWSEGRRDILAGGESV